MRRRYLKKLVAVVFAAVMLSGVAFVSPSTVEAQGHRRVIIVRPYRHQFYGRRWYGYPWYGNQYSQYVFSNSDKAEGQGYKDGFKTGRDDGKKQKSFDPQRSHYFHDSGFGNFAEIYRSGFSRGYQQGFREGQSQRAS
jgi:hypothetical protein